MYRRLLVAAACAAVVAAVVIPIAGADPGNAKNSSLIRAVCGGRTVTVVVNGNGEFTPAFAIFPLLSGDPSQDKPAPFISRFLYPIAHSA